MAVETFTPGPGRACRDYVPEFVERFADAYREEIEHLVHVVRSGAEARPSGAATVLARAAERSYREERTVRLNSDQERRDVLRGGRLERSLEGR